LKDWRKCLQLTVIVLLKRIGEDENIFTAAIRKKRCVVLENMGSAD